MKTSISGASASPTRSASAIARSLKRGRSHHVWIAIPLIAGLLMGCRTVGPDYTRPKMRPPDAFRGSTDVTPPDDSSSLADLKWFEVFKDEQLQRLISAALESNYDLRDAVARVDAARANLGITRADEFPTIGASSSITTIPRPDAINPAARWPEPTADCWARARAASRPAKTLAWRMSASNCDRALA